MRPSSRESDRSQERSDADGMGRLADRDCLVLAREGSRPAQEELIRRYAPVVYRLSLRLSRDRELASDATQEVFLRALAAMGRFDPEGSFRAWVCTIAWNVFRDELRRARLRPRPVAAGARDDRDDEEMLDVEDTRQDAPHEILERKERRELVDRALARLEPGTRAILLLRDVEGLSYGELAQFLGCNLGTVKSRIHRARREFKDVITALGPSWFGR